jgi:hypothetical protein
MRIAIGIGIVVVAVLSAVAAGPIRVPPPQFESDYNMPSITTPPPGDRPGTYPFSPHTPPLCRYIDAVLLSAVMAFGVYMVARKGPLHVPLALGGAIVVYFGLWHAAVGWLVPMVLREGAHPAAQWIIALATPPAADPSDSVSVGGELKTGFRSPSKKLEWYSETLDSWGWSDAAIPTYLRSHVNWRDLDLAGNERILLPIFRLPTLIHTRSGNAKYLYEISHGHPLWINPGDADALGVETGQMVRITTDIGWFVMRAWRTEGIRPGVVAASHHLGRWRLSDDSGNERWSSALVDIEKLPTGEWRLRQKKGIEPFESEDPDSSRIWWRDPGVNQNLAFPVHPDPVSGMHAWHQRVRLTHAEAGDRYGDVVVDTAKSTQIFEEWLEMTKPAPGPDGTRRPMWLDRPVKPTADAYRF